MTFTAHELHQGHISSLDHCLQVEPTDPLKVSNTHYKTFIKQSKKKIPAYAEDVDTSRLKSWWKSKVQIAVTCVNSIYKSVGGPSSPTLLPPPSPCGHKYSLPTSSGVKMSRPLWPSKTSWKMVTWYCWVGFQYNPAIQGCKLWGVARKHYSIVQDHECTSPSIGVYMHVYESYYKGYYPGKMMFSNPHCKSTIYDHLNNA